MSLLAPGSRLDGFVIGECLHAGGMAHIYAVQPAPGQADPGFALVMKVPRMTAGDGAENIIGFEVELQILPALAGPHVPRFVAAGDLLQVTPYLVMEQVSGRTLESWLAKDETGHAPQLAVDDIARLGAATAHALYSLHQQNTVHQDLKPGNVLIKPDGVAVLLDFGLSCHAQFPDLLAEQMRKAVGSPGWIAPEQVVGVRGDLRSDIFALGVVLYQLTCGRLPFGMPQTAGGLRQRLWADPVPPRKLRPDLPEWLQEVILHCLEPVAARRYPSAAQLAFDLAHPEQVQVTARGRNTVATGFWTHFKRWLRAAGMHYQASPLPAQQIAEAPIVMVAVPHQDVTEATLQALRQSTARTLGTRPGARLACVTVVPQGSTTDAARSDTQLHRLHLGQLRQWAQPLDLRGHTASFQVLESSDVAQALLAYARNNRVSLLVMGAATHGLKLQRFVATVPIRVAMEAPCTVILVKPPQAFEQPGAVPGDD